MTVLITGGMGFIGLHTARAFLDAGQDVVITWYQTWREPDFIKDEYGKRVIVEKADVSQGSVIKDLAVKHKADHIVHLAVPGLGALDAAADYHVNMDGLIGVLEAAREAGVKRLSFASSVAVYNSLPKGPYREDQPLPVESGNPTEAFKKSWEILALHYGNRAQIDVVSLRIGGIWGPLYHTLVNLPSKFAHAAAHGVEPDFTTARGGAPHAGDTNDLCYVKDTAQGIMRVQLAEKLEHRIYNVSWGEPVPVSRLAAAVTAVKPGAKLGVSEGRGPRFKENNHLDVSRIKTELGFKPDYTVESGMAEYIAWLEAGNET
ncbi:MAG: NAD(P)-dependent oxidoreductase [Chloroflexi bacterium]|nr:NAD(P)-dependent oxidoreductase [Chloroflexota bacterium]MCI0888724.1 NAD(P)-dependent oxidoreductase [Chloroflexota bacterium]